MSSYIFNLQPFLIPCLSLNLLRCFPSGGDKLIKLQAKSQQMVQMVMSHLNDTPPLPQKAEFHSRACWSLPLQEHPGRIQSSQPEVKGADPGLLKYPCARDPNNSWTSCTRNRKCRKIFGKLTRACFNDLQCVGCFSIHDTFCLSCIECIAVAVSSD